MWLICILRWPPFSATLAANMSSASSAHTLSPARSSTATHSLPPTSPSVLLPPTPISPTERARRDREAQRSRASLPVAPNPQTISQVLGALDVLEPACQTNRILRTEFPDGCPTCQRAWDPSLESYLSLLVVRYETIRLMRRILSDVRTYR